MCKLKKMSNAKCAPGNPENNSEDEDEEAAAAAAAEVMAAEGAQQPQDVAPKKGKAAPEPEVRVP